MNPTEACQPGESSLACAARWHDSMAAASFQGRGAEFWDNWVRSLPEKREHSGYVEEVLSRMACLPSDEVLDVGAGTGALCLPLAKKTRQVTALDQSRPCWRP
jgi:2-polyprenyl-3-methyl-5-hydroxy-6-metoxy-1,4-benzoquinol methylase